MKGDSVHGLLIGYGCLISRGIEGQAGWGPGQADLVVGNPANGRGLEPDDLQDPLHPKPVRLSMIFFIVYVHS